MQNKLSWQAYSSGIRNKIIDEVKSVISVNDGAIVNFSMFSDLALSMSIEIEECSVASLHEALSHILTISDYNEGNLCPNSQKECRIFLNISFGGGKGELKNEIPAVPG